jgi:hypothetical protein
MAVIGARPASGFGPWGRIRPRTSRPAAPRRARRRSLVGRRARPINISGLLLAIVAAAALGFFYLSQSSHVAATGYLLDDLDARMVELRMEQQQLIYEIGRARSPAVIEQKAKQDLKLAPIGPDRTSFAAGTTSK